MHDPDQRRAIRDGSETERVGLTLQGIAAGAHDIPAPGTRLHDERATEATIANDLERNCCTAGGAERDPLQRPRRHPGHTGRRPLGHREDWQRRRDPLALPPRVGRIVELDS